MLLVAVSLSENSLTGFWGVECGRERRVPRVRKALVGRQSLRSVLFQDPGVPVPLPEPVP